MVTALGTLYGIGVGPGDPDLITVRGSRILATTRHVFVPRGRRSVDCAALRIAQQYMNSETVLHEIIFPMTSDPAELYREWNDRVVPIVEVLRQGLDACYLTLGDTLLYSTYIYMLRALRVQLPGAQVVTVPGVTAFSAVAAAAEFPIGAGKETVTIVPVAADLDNVRSVLARGGTTILMKIGKRLKSILNLLEKEGSLDRSIFVSHAGMENQRLETDLRKLKEEAEDETGNLSVILVHGPNRNNDPRVGE